jgi:hypothetical protein
MQQTNWGRIKAGLVRDVKQRRSGVTAGGWLLSVASSHLTGADFLVGMDRRRSGLPCLSGWTGMRRLPPLPVTEQCRAGPAQH